MTQEQLERRSEIVQAITEANYGDLFEHSELLKISGIESTDSPAYRGMIKAVKKECEKEGKAIKAVPGIGYRVLRPGEYAEQAAKKARAGMNRFKSGVSLLQHAPVDDMTADERRDFNDVSGSYNAVIGAVSSRTAEIEAASRRALLAASIR